MTNTRTRVVNFRVTAAEFERLKIASSQQRARSLSDFARTVMLAQYDLGTVRNSYDERFVSIDRRVADIERSMAELVEAFSGAQLQQANSETTSISTA